MRNLDVFLAPISDGRAQVAVLALLLLSALDVLFGVGKATLVSHDFSSHELRAGLMRKLSNLGMVCVADIVDAMLLGGLELGFQPVLITIAVSLSLMEVASLLEIYAEIHPEISEAAWYQMLAHSKDSMRGVE